VRIFERDDGGKNQHNERGAAQMKLEGLPEGYEAVRWGWPEEGEQFLNIDGKVLTTTTNHAPVLDPPRLVVRKVEPVATWPRGVFQNGWIAEDEDRCQYWYSTRPDTDLNALSWNSTGTQYGMIFLRKPVVFRSDLPWTERCVQVGLWVENQQ
jgi:hypothetical protein